MTETTADQNSDFSSSPPTSRLEDGNLVTNLQCQLKSFQIRVKELEAQNAALYLQLSNCHCQKLVERSDASAVFGDALAKGRKKSSIGDNMVQLSIGGNHNDVKIKDAKREGENGAVNEAKKNSSRILKTMNRHSKRYVALKVMYFGQRFHGFASVQVDPTIEVVDALLDTTRIHRKPQFCMAPELPLVLRSCEFEGLKFSCSSDAGSDLQEHFKSEVRNYKLQAAIFQEALLGCSSMENCKSPSNQCKKVAHIPLLSRPTEPTYEERLAKLKVKAEP